MQVPTTIGKLFILRERAIVRFVSHADFLWNSDDLQQSICEMVNFGGITLYKLYTLGQF